MKSSKAELAKDQLKGTRGKPSRLEPHAALILELAGQAMPWTRIAARLGELGVQTTGRAVSTWAERRARRLARRAGILDPLGTARAGGLAAQPSPMPPVVRPPSRAAGRAPVPAGLASAERQAVAPPAAPVHPMLRRKGGELDDLIDEAAGADGAAGSLLLGRGRKTD